MLKIVSEVHRSHPSLTDLALEGVSALKGCVEVGGGIGHDLPYGSARSTLSVPRHDREVKRHMHMII